MWTYILFIAIFLAVSLFRSGLKSLWVFIPPSAKGNIFSKDFLFPKPAEVELNQAKRDKVLKNGFTADKIPDKLDAIVIGSGIGGLTTAALLARAGKRVLVLEQHDQAGGCCHVFEEKGYEFDIGIHYIGKMREGGLTRILMDQLSQGRLQWHAIADDYDVVVTGENYDNKWPINKDPKVQMERLIAKFPEEEEAIRKYFKCVREACTATTPLFLLKAVPRWLGRALVKTGLMQRIFPALKYVDMTLSDVLNKITNNLELRTIFSYAFGDYGTVPGEAPFMMHASLMAHFYQGGYYPVGGASEIAHTIIPTIEQAGGRVLVRANVKEILLNQANEAVGVRVSKGNQDHTVLAPMVISAAGVVNTFSKLLPEKVVKESGINMGGVKSGKALFSVFVGLEGSKEELGLVDTNYWIFNNVDIEKSVAEYMRQSPEEVRNRDIPLLFLSFPSTKDPLIGKRYPGRSTCAIITMTPYEWFEEWRDERLMHRGPDYQALKMDIGRRMWNQVCTLFPHLEDKMDYIDVGSPLSNRYYLGTQRGEVYGIDHNMLRFSPLTQIELRPETPISGLYLTGQDILTCGFSGAMHSGLLTASVILQRNLIADLTTMQTIWKKEQKKK